MNNETAQTRLKSFRKLHKLTQKDVAEIIGYDSQGSVANFEKKRLIPVNRAKKLIAFIRERDDVSYELDYFYPDEGEEA